MPKQRSKHQPMRDHVAFVVSSLSNPKEPQHCGTCLYAALVQAIPSSEVLSTRSYTIPTSLRKKVDFWNTLYAFIFQPRTDEEVESLLRVLGRCFCPSPLRQLQSYAVGKNTEHRNSTLALAPEDRKTLYTPERIAFITEALVIFTDILYGSGVKSVAKGPLQTWPTTPQDLVPFGADSLVQTLLQWYRFIPDPIVFGLAGRITHVCRFILVPSLAKFQFSRPAILRGKKEVEALEPHLRTASQFAPAAQLIVQRFSWYFTNFFEYFRVIYKELPPHTRLRILAGYETKAMQLFSLLVYVSTNPYPPSTIANAQASDDCGTLCHELFRFFHMHLYPHPDYPVHPSVVQIDDLTFHPRASYRSVPSAVAYYLMEFHQETQCCAYGCPGSMQSAGNNFQRCSRCQIVSYCGRECQTRAWRDEKFPHKRVCPIIRLLIEAAGGLDMFVPNSSQNLKILNLPANVNARRPMIAQIWEDGKIDRAYSNT
ncbi:hypothetical protein CPB83DRAFT_289576 [Crepidotus variabilis]|uniref:MYND-type domain-containing protein n=1 Tax=Crepidotus variabilis TaxID=179855 RepID=A0A9P6EH18_9AGAR|nr:hypothetical protein CPB83DRAFT_289576 [Crepidotus variabilis]